MTSTETATEAIHRADQAMYLAKRSGKNRVLPA
jgi:diguanylate cyclase